MNIPSYASKVNQGTGVPFLHECPQYPVSPWCVKQGTECGVFTLNTEICCHCELNLTLFKSTRPRHSKGVNHVKTQQ